MRNIYLIIPAVTFFLFSCQKQSVPDNALVIRDANIINVKNGELEEDRTVIIVDNRIQAIGSRDEFIGSGAKEIDASGKFMIPGLWDMHVHATFAGWIKTFYPVFIANGVTGIRDMWGVSEVARKAKNEIAQGKLLGPRIVVAGNMVDGLPPLFSGSVIVSTATEAEAAVDSLQKSGADFIKVQSRLSRDAYFAIISKARQRGIVVAGHVPYSVLITEVSDSGQKSIEHLYGILEGSSAEEEAIKQVWQELLVSPDNDRRHLALEKMLDSFSKDRCRALAQRFVLNETWQVPTLVVLKAYSFPEEWELLTEDPRINIIPAMMRSSWDIDSNSFVSKRKPADWNMQQQVFQKYLVVVDLLNREGVRLLAGTDTPNPSVFPGYGLHDELSLLVEAGLTPAEALRAATLNPAQFLGTKDSLGTVEEGKIADLVLLNADPLENINNTRSIYAVIVNGNLLDRSILDETIEKIQKTHKNESIRALLQKYMSASINHETEIISEMTHEDIVWHLGPFTLKGKEAALGPNEYDTGTRADLEYSNAVFRGDTVEFELIERNEILSATGMERIRLYPRFVFKDGLIYKKETWKVSPDVQEMIRRAQAMRKWMQETHPEIVAELIDSDGNFIFNRKNGELNLQMALEWKQAIQEQK
jgi:Amidohydrolase family